MKNQILSIVLNSTDLLAVQRAKRILRLRYGVVIQKPHADPVWLSAYNL